MHGYILKLVCAATVQVCTLSPLAYPLPSMTLPDGTQQPRTFANQHACETVAGRWSQLNAIFLDSGMTVQCVALPD